MQELTTFIGQHSLLSSCVLIVFILVMVIEFLRAKRTVFQISLPKAIQLINHDNAAIIDIRTNEAYRKSHVLNAISIQKDDIKTSPKKLEKYKIRPLILTCNTGIESQKMAALLLKQGYNAYSLQGGIRTWIEGQMPMVEE